MAENLKLIAEFKIATLPKMTNAIGRSHWSKKYKEAAKWKRLVALECHNAEIAGLELISAALTLTRHSSIEPDFDGLVSGFKHVIDGLVEMRVITNDKSANIGQPVYLWKHSPKRVGGFITVKIEAPC